MELGLRERVVIVTGGARGIGLGIARVLGAEGATPVIFGHNANDNEAAVKSIGERAAAVTAELTRTEECRRAVAAGGARLGRIFGPVTNPRDNERGGLRPGGHRRVRT